MQPVQPVQPERTIEGVSPPPIPVIYDTDIGTDIDDTWALALILASPELDLRLVVTDSGDTTTRARIAAKFLEASGRADVPIAIGVHEEREIPIGQASWAEDYDLASYPGPVYENGVDLLVETILESSEPLTLLAVGPVPNLEEALRREPGIVDRVRVVAMSGSVDRGCLDRPDPHPEYNVVANVAAASAMYGAGWDLTIAPLDTAGQVKIEGPRYARLRDSDSPMVAALLDSYRSWAPHVEWASSYDTDSESTVLYDALAVVLAFDESFCELEELRLVVNDEGYTVRDPEGRTVRSAQSWRRPREELEELIVRRLTGG